MDQAPPAKQIRLMQESTHTVFDDPVTYSILSAFTAQRSSVDPNPPLSLSVLDDHLIALNAILDSWDRIFNPMSIEGATGFINSLDPCALAAGTTNNPNILSQLAMLWAND